MEDIILELDEAVSQSKVLKKDKISKNGSKGLENLRVDMSYSEARKIVLDARWQRHGSAIKDLWGQAKQLYFDNGWREVQTCAMSAGSPCCYEFRDINQKN